MIKHIKYYILLCLIFICGSLISNDWWLESDYLLWTIKKAPCPVPLVTSASLNDPLPGALGQPGTKVLLGDKKIDLHCFNGFRITLGRSFENCLNLAIEGSFFILPQKKHHQSVHTSGEPGSLNLAVPIFDVTGLWGLNGLPGETVFILPGPLFGPGFEGRFKLKLSSELLGSDLNILTNLISDCVYKIDLIGGFRWLQLKETFSFIGKTDALPNAPFAMGFYNFKDSFKTNNHFYGPQIGLKLFYNLNKWSFNAFAKAALGCINHKLRIEGKSQTSDGNLFYMTKNTSNQIIPGGLFSEPTNQGSHKRNHFGVVLESGLNLSYQLSRCFEIGIGYNFLWLNQVLRPGDQIDRRINPTRTALAQVSRASAGVGPDMPVPFGESAAAPLPSGPDYPKAKHHTSNFWAQGLAISLNIKF